MKIIKWIKEQSIYSVPVLMLLSAIPHWITGKKLAISKYGSICVDYGNDERVAINCIFPQWFVKIVIYIKHPKYGLWKLKRRYFNDSPPHRISSI
jgi:ribose/xylose/arabinose/galactoside ABC-type transport system permease subunit